MSETGFGRLEAREDMESSRVLCELKMMGRKQPTAEWSREEQGRMINTAPKGLSILTGILFRSKITLRWGSPQHMMQMKCFPNLRLPAWIVTTQCNNLMKTAKRISTTEFYYPLSDCRYSLFYQGLFMVIN